MPTQRIPMQKQKKIAMIAHDNQKQTLWNGLVLTGARLPNTNYTLPAPPVKFLQASSVWKFIASLAGL